MSFSVAAQITPKAPTTPPAAPEKEVVIDPKARDGEIAARLVRIFAASGWFYALSVEVREGIAFLDGETETDEHREWAGQLARKTQDVVAVVNRIEVVPRISWDFSPAWQEVRRLAVRGQQLLPLLLLGALILVLSWLAAYAVARLSRWGLRRRITSPLLLTVAARTLAIPVFLLGLYLILQVAGLTRLALTVLGGTGILGIVLGFAFRDIAENFLASLLLSIRNPFRAGDLIEVASHQGIVQSLNTRSTVLLTLDGNHVQIPNGTVYKSTIINFTSSAARRSDFLVGIGYDDPVGRAQEIIVTAVNAHPAVLDDPEATALVDELAAASVNLRVYFWFNSHVYSPNKLRSALIRTVKRALQDGGITLPDESREVIFPQGVPIYRMQEHHARSDDSASERRSATIPADEQVATAGEGDLTAEEADVQRQATRARNPEEAETLLGDK